MMNNWYINDVDELPEALRKRIEMTNEKQGWANNFGHGKTVRPATHFGRGWLPIIERLDQDLAEIDPEYEIHQIKEKFGGLRYYVDFSFDDFRKWDRETQEEVIADPETHARFRQACDLITEAEWACGLTCEVCGEWGQTLNEDAKNFRMIRTRCEEHNETV